MKCVFTTVLRLVAAAVCGLTIPCLGMAESQLGLFDDKPYKAISSPLFYFAVTYAMAIYGYIGNTKPFALLSAVVLAIVLAVIEARINSQRGFAAEACMSILVPAFGFMLGYVVGIIAEVQKSIRFLLIGTFIVDIFSKVIAMRLVEDLPFGLCGSSGMHLKRNLARRTEERRA